MSTRRLWHLALASEWEEARAGNGYRTSTLGRTLDEVGFTHCAHAAQVEGVADRFYAEVEVPLVLLEIDPSLLQSPVVEEVPDGRGEAFPHVYGPVDLAAVVGVHEVGRRSDGSFVLPSGLTSSGGIDPSS